MVVCGVKSTYVAYIQNWNVRYHSEANVDVKILFGKVTHLKDPEIREMLGRTRENFVIQ